MELQQKQICLLTKCEIGYKRGNFQKYIGRHAHYHTNRNSQIKAGYRRNPSKKNYIKASFQTTNVFLNHSDVWFNASSWAFFNSGTDRLARDANPWVVPIEKKEKK